MESDILDIPDEDVSSPTPSLQPSSHDIVPSRPSFKQISRSGEGGNDDDGGIVDMGPPSSIEPCALPFVFPKNFKDMTWEEKENLHREFVKHNLTDSRDDLADSSPSMPAYPGSPEWQRQMDERKRAIAELRRAEPFDVSMFEFDKEKGYIVQETPETLADALARSNLDPDEIEKMIAPKQICRHVSEKEIGERLNSNKK
jgi:hypothetical protein